ncbi:MAG: NAD-dependent epimerase/dehydratase family protein [Gammaproteobacteria bacterium]|nr:NAD-dependent epimerase/dehydratase family protein [Gammaproteobacteria bacterium]
MNETNHYPLNIVGCGYLGRKLLNELLLRNLFVADKITTLVKTQSSQEHCAQTGVHSIAYDMDDCESQLPDSIVIDQSLIYYFAPPPSHGEKDSRAKNFLKQLSQKEAHQQPSKIVLISTTGVYGNCHGQWVDENTPVNPGVDRARRRFDAEQQFQHYSQKFNIPLVILRVSGIYGPEKMPLKRIQAQTPIVREEDSPFSNRIHADDLLEVCLIAGLSNEIEGIYNCADGHPTTMYDYFMKVAQANHLPEPPTISLEQAKTQLSAGMLSYMEESRRIDNQKLLTDFKISLKYPDLNKGLFVK